MVNVKLGDQTYEGVQTVRMDTAEGGTVDFAPYDETFAAGRADGYNAGKEDGLEEGFNNGKTAGIEEGYIEGKAAGRAEGYTEGKAAGIEEGIQTEYDRFWDAYQDGGKRFVYSFAFAGRSAWNKETFRPKYDIVPGAGNTADHMFRQFGYAPSSGTASVQEKITDLTEHLQNIGIRLDTSKVYSFGYMFNGSELQRVPEINMTMATGADGMFRDCSVVTIDKLIANEKCAWNDCFQGATSLANITFEGIIGQNINFQWSPLSVASMKSVITHLKNFSGTADAGKKTVKFMDTCWAALEADGTTAPDGTSWRDYVETTLGWLS